MDPLVSLEDALAFVGVAADAPAATTVALMLDAISEEMRRLTRRAFERTGTDYVQVLRIDASREFVVPQVPIDLEMPIIVQPVLFDGSVLFTLDPTEYRVEDAARGRLRILEYVWHRTIQIYRRYDYVQVSWSTTGEIPATIRLGALTWLKDSWIHRNDNRALAGYQTGKDAETYFPNMIGVPPRSVARALLGYWHAPGIEAVITGESSSGVI